MSRRPDPLISTLKQVLARTQSEELMFVDPGSGGTGWAIFKMPSEVTEPIRPLEFGALSSRSGLWHDKFAEIAVAFADEVLFEHGPDRVVHEWPELWAGSAKSQASTSDGDLFKLSALIGALELAVLQCDMEPSLFVTPRWKGQMDKKAVDERIARAIGCSYPNHVSDAVGMGLAVMGTL